MVECNSEPPTEAGAKLEKRNSSSVNGPKDEKEWVTQVYSYLNKRESVEENRVKQVLDTPPSNTVSTVAKPCKLRSVIAATAPPLSSHADVPLYKEPPSVKAELNREPVKNPELRPPYRISFP